MPKKLGKDEEILLFALKIVGPIAFAFLVAVGTDIADVFSRFDGLNFDGSDLVSEITYQWYMLF